MSRVLPVLLLLISFAGTLELRSSAAAHLTATRSYDPRSFVPHPEVLPVLSLGYDRALADLLWMRALVYLGEEFEHRESAKSVFDHTDAILALDPDFKAAYWWIGVTGTYRAGEVTTDDYLRTLDYLRRAAERFPDDPEVRWDLGAMMVYDQPRELREGQPELSERIELEGLEHVEYAAVHDAAPPWVLFTATTKRYQLGQTEQALTRLRELVGLVEDPDIRQGLEQRILQLQTESAGLLRDAELEHLERRHRATYPWVPLGLWILVDDPAADPDGLMGESGDAMLPAPDGTQQDASD